MELWNKAEFEAISYSSLAQYEIAALISLWVIIKRKKDIKSTEDVTQCELVCVCVCVCVCVRHIYSRRIPEGRPCDWPPPHRIWQDITTTHTHTHTYTNIYKHVHTKTNKWWECRRTHTHSHTQETHNSDKPRAQHVCTQARHNLIDFFPYFLLFIVFLNVIKCIFALGRALRFRV